MSKLIQLIKLTMTEKLSTFLKTMFILVIIGMNIACSSGEYSNYKGLLKHIDSLFIRNKEKIKSALAEGEEKIIYLANSKKNDQEFDELMNLINFVWGDNCNQTEKLCSQYHGDSLYFLKATHYAHIDELHKLLTTSCFEENGEKIKYVHDSCPMDYEKLCANFSYEGNRPYEKALKENFEIETIFFDSEDDYKTFLSNTRDEWLGVKWSYDFNDHYKYTICKAYGLSAENLKKKNKIELYGKSDWRKTLEDFDMNRRYQEETKHIPFKPQLDDCGIVSPKTLRNIYGIGFYRDNPTIESLFILKDACEKMIPEFCQDMGFIGDEVYVTTFDNSCNKIKIFFSDFMRASEQQVMTDADRESQRTSFRKSMDLCKKMNQLGYEWKTIWEASGKCKS